MRDRTTDSPPSVPQAGALEGTGLRQVVVVLSTVQIVSWGVLYYAFAALQSSITADTGWSSVTGDRGVLTGPVHLRWRRDLGRAPHRRLRTPPSDDRRLPGGRPRGARSGVGAEPVVVLPRLGAGRRGDGRHPVPACVRGVDPLGWEPPGRGPDDADTGRRSGQHRLRSPGIGPRRLARLAGGVPGTPSRADHDHGPAALVGARPPLELRTCQAHDPASKTPQCRTCTGAEHRSPR